MSSLDRSGTDSDNDSDGAQHLEPQQPTTTVQLQGAVGGGGRREGGRGGDRGMGAVIVPRGSESCSPRDPEKRKLEVGLEESTVSIKNHATQQRPPRSTHDTPATTPDLSEKEDGAEERQQQQQRQHRHHHRHHNSRIRQSRRTNSDAFYGDDRPVVDVEQAEGSAEIGHRHKSSYVWRVLCYLTLLAPFLSVLCALYTLYTLLLLILSYPVQNLTSSACPPFSTTVVSRLLPALKLHMRLLYRRRHPFPSPDEVGAARLVRVHVLSPLVAIPIAAVGASISFVWLYTEVLLGDKNDEKGMEYRGFVWVRQRWENFVLSSLKPKELPEGGDSSFREG